MKSAMKTKYVYPATYKYEDNNTISIFFPDIDNIFTNGDSLEECLFNAKECLELYIESSLDEGIKLPSPSDYNNIKGNKFLVIADIEKRNAQVNFG